ncbi:MAG: riboflavin synthase [Deltaproteobacteria bacterium]|nr:MAG: riboflavin synthase [Deltaproteobacteria bacterium]
MFTGLVEDVGRIAAVNPIAEGGARLTVATRFADDDLGHGASIAVDGACLTVVGRDLDTFTSDVSVETLERTTLGRRKPGDPVNLERPLALGERLGGHLVLGHIDGVGRIRSREPAGDAQRFVVEIPRQLMALVVEKGSIALDGISLTVNEIIGQDAISLMIIPETLRATTFGARKPGDPLNVEADILGKHVARLLAYRSIE